MIMGERKGKRRRSTVSSKEIPVPVPFQACVHPLISRRSTSSARGIFSVKISKIARRALWFYRGRQEGSKCVKGEDNAHKE